MPKKEKPLNMGERIARLRIKKSVSIEELSELTGLKNSHLKDIESGKSFAPVGDILKISRALTVDPDDLLTESPVNEKEKKKKRTEDFKTRETSYLYEVLTPQARAKHLRAFRITIPAKSEHPKINYQHEGEEFVHVLDGQVDITVGQKKNSLKKGDSLHFNSGIKHTLKNPGAKDTHLIVVVYNP